METDITKIANRPICDTCGSKVVYVRQSDYTLVCRRCGAVAPLIKHKFRPIPLEDTVWKT